MATDVMGPVATLDSAVFAGRHYEECLSEREREEFSRIRHDRRRNEWLAGRLSAKFLFLEQGAGGRPALRHLSTADLESFPPALYRSTEVVRSGKVGGGCPWVGWRPPVAARAASEPMERRPTPGRDARDVAIAHSNGIACALLGSGEAVAVDLERAESRIPAFYAGNFTARERTWAEGFSHQRGLDPHWTFTLLWTIKECLLKTSVYSDLTIWDMPALEVRIGSGEEGLVHPHFARKISGGFEFLGVEATGRNRTVSLLVAVAGRYDLVLTAIRGVERRMF